MATLLYGVVDPEEGRLRLATAGHPPVLVIGPAGDAYFAEGPAGSPLGRGPVPHLRGVDDPARARLHRAPLHRRAGRAARVAARRGARVAARPGRRRPGAPRRALRRAAADALSRRAAARRRRPARGPARAGRRSSASSSPCARSPSRWRRCAARVGRWLRAAGASDAETYEALVACGEACANAIAHAYPPGEASYVVEGRRHDGAVELRVRDFGSWRAPRAGSQGRGPGPDRGADGRRRDRARVGGDDRAHAAAIGEPETPGVAAA